jgi:hypothetical protein
VDGAQVDVPAPLGHVVGVADIVPELRPFAAEITNMCHETAPGKIRTCCLKELFYLNLAGFASLCGTLLSAVLISGFAWLSCALVIQPEKSFILKIKLNYSENQSQRRRTGASAPQLALY